MDAFSAAAQQYIAIYGRSPSAAQLRAFLNSELADCTGNIDTDNILRHDGDTCPVHEARSL